MERITFDCRGTIIKISKSSIMQYDTRFKAMIEMEGKDYYEIDDDPKYFRKFINYISGYLDESEINPSLSKYLEYCGIVRTLNIDVNNTGDLYKMNKRVDQLIKDLIKIIKYMQIQQCIHIEPIVESKKSIIECLHGTEQIIIRYRPSGNNDIMTTHGLLHTINNWLSTYYPSFFCEKNMDISLTKFTIKLKSST